MLKILVVDDDKHSLILYSRELKEEGYHSIPAANLQEALNLIQTECPDLVVFDIRPPASYGLNAIHRVLSADPHAPAVIVISCNRCMGQSPLARFAASCVDKSSDLNELKRTIRGLAEA